MVQSLSNKMNWLVTNSRIQWNQPNPTLVRIRKDFGLEGFKCIVNTQLCILTMSDPEISGL